MKFQDDEERRVRGSFNEHPIPSFYAPKNQPAKPRTPPNHPLLVVTDDKSSTDVAVFFFLESVCKKKYKLKQLQVNTTMYIKTHGSCPLCVSRSAKT